MIDARKHRNRDDQHESDRTTGDPRSPPFPPPDDADRRHSLNLPDARLGSVRTDHRNRIASRWRVRSRVDLEEVHRFVASVTAERFPLERSRVISTCVRDRSGPATAITPSAVASFEPDELAARLRRTTPGSSRSIRSVPS
ncbi:hypothetical protein D8S78_00655 [Natrialba swarupiae]|nr:hypothetical protein [Natrialba swarupiae]